MLHVPPVQHPLPGITVAMLSNHHEATIKQAVRSIDKVLQGHKWSLVVVVNGHHDDAGGIVKREWLSAQRVLVYQLDEVPLGDAWNRVLVQAKALRYENPFFTLVDGSCEMAELWRELVAAAILHGHTALLGDADGAEPPWTVALDGRADFRLGVYRSDLLAPDHRLFDGPYGSDVDHRRVFWHTLWHRGVEPGVWWPSVTVGRVAPERPAEDPLEGGTANWLQRCPKPNHPDLLAYLAIGDQAIEETRLSIASARRVMVGDRIEKPVLIATDQVERVERWGLRDVEVMPHHSLMAEADQAIEHYAGDPGIRRLFWAVAGKCTLAREALRRGSCVVTDSDILFARPFGRLPGWPASSPKSCPWNTSGSYSNNHQWGCTSAGLLWFPNGSFDFVSELYRQTLLNIRQYRPHRAFTSVPGGSEFAEQDGWDMACFGQQFDILPPGHNVTPAMLGGANEYLSTWGGRGIVREACRMFGFSEGAGLWLNGWPVRSLHCHWWGRQRWNPEFERLVLTSFSAQAETADLARLVERFAPPSPGDRAEDPRRY